MFDRFIGLDYSGAETPVASLKGLRIYQAARKTPPTEVFPPPSPRKYWTRRGVAEWLLKQLAAAQRPILVGIDHAFSFPEDYFEAHGLARDWPAFLDDFQRHWPTDESISVDSVRNGLYGNSSARSGNTRWRRLTERRAKSAKSVFYFDVQGSVAKSTHSGLPWLRFLRKELGGTVHFWPFDGWLAPQGISVIVEVYPRLWNRLYPRQDRTADQHDAWSVAEHLRSADEAESLRAYFEPNLSDEEIRLAEFEGWIFGVT